MMATASLDAGSPAVLAADLRVALLRTGRRLRAETSDADLSPGQFSVLAQLSRRGPQTSGELAAFEHVRPPSMTRTVTALEQLGLVVRDGDPRDGRVVVVRLTDAGRSVVEQTRHLREQWLAERLADLTQDERNALVTAAAVLRRIAES